ncbi:MAG: sugar ABC transporter substrate-binding protein [Tissierellia bacterium]|nr:sugar ABC transporter substrate-binding protein [Tissierellia bacterium]
MKKVVYLLLSLLFLISFTSCSNKKDQENSSKLRLAMWDVNQEKVMKKIVEKYEKAHPNVKIQIEMASYPDHMTKLETEAQGDTMPDIVYMNGPNFIKFASNDLLTPLDDVIKEKNIDMSVFPDSLKELYTYEGKLYGIPKDWDLTALWYNKEIFDKKHVDYPTDDWTWDDFIKAAEKLTDKDEGIWGTSAKAMTQEGIYDTIPQCGGYIITDDMKHSGYDTKEALKGVNVWLDLIDRGISPNLETMRDTVDTELFKAGKLAMIYSASWNVPEFMENENIKDKIDLVQMPLIKERKATIHGLSYCIPIKAKHKEEAKDFISYLASDEANDMWAEAATVIPANKNSLDKWEKAYPTINLKAFIDELDYSVMYPISKNTMVWNWLEDDAINEMFSRQKPADEVLKQLSEDMDTALKNE